MPPLPSPGDFFAIDCMWSDASDVNVSNRFYFEYEGGEPTAADANAIATEFTTLMGNTPGLWTPDTVLTGAKVTDLSSDEGVVGIHTASIAGTASGASLAGGTCLVVSYIIGRRYRGGKPRNYFPWGSATNLVNRQTWETGFLTNAGTHVTGITSGMSGFVSGDITVGAHTNISYYQGFTTPTPAPGKRAKNISTPRVTPRTDPITANVPAPNPGSQRRRNR